MFRSRPGHFALLFAFAAVPMVLAGNLLPENVKAVPVFDPSEVVLDKPVWFGEMPGKPETFVVLERLTGVVALVSAADSKDGKDTGAGKKWIKSEFLKVSVNGEGEMGLLGIAFHPGFADNRKYYLNYNPGAAGSSGTPGSSGVGPLATLIEEREAAADFSKDSGKPPRQVMRILQTRHGNHKGGAIAFGPKDGFLYIGMGDGAESLNAQDRKSLLGKMLRVDVNVPDSFSVPPDNPFVADSGTRPEIWAMGLRNPWRWSFDRATGDLWAGDVGDIAREEINKVERGANLGWPFREGTVCLEPDSCTSRLASPLLELGRAHSTTVIGGEVYRGNPSSPFHGAYFFADFELRTLWAMLPEEGKSISFQRLFTLPDKPSSFGMDSKGNIYVVGYEDGVIYRLESPDMQSIGIGILPRSGRVSGPGGLLRTRRGRPLDLSVLGRFKSLDFFSLDGRLQMTLPSGSAPSRTGRTGVGSRVLDLPQGLYFLRIRGSGSDAVRRLLVE